MTKTKKGLTRRQVIILAFFLSILLFSMGLYSGLTASKIVREQNEEEFGVLLNYVTQLKDNLNSLQIEELFINSLNEKQRCILSENRFTRVAEELNHYWNIFPTRIEAYEQGRTLTRSYQQLKKEYIKLSLRAWIISRDNYEKCHSNTIPVLYFYDQNCTNCSKQGEILDEVKTIMKKEGKNVLVFTIDSKADESIITLIKQYYNVSQVPALIINEQVLQGHLFSTNDIIKKLE